MLYNLAARAYLMVVDCQLSLDEALIWVTRRLPVNLRDYYGRRITDELLATV
jgi:hypothetical protein